MIILFISSLQLTEYNMYRYQMGGLSGTRVDIKLKAPSHSDKMHPVVGYLIILYISIKVLVT